MRETMQASQAKTPCPRASTKCNPSMNLRPAQPPNRPTQIRTFSMNPNNPFISTYRRPFRSRYRSATPASCAKPTWFAKAKARTSSITPMSTLHTLTRQLGPLTEPAGSSNSGKSFLRIEEMVIEQELVIQLRIGILHIPPSQPSPSP